MSSVISAQKCLEKMIINRSIFKIKPVKQNKSLQIRYTKNKNFNDKLLKNFFKSKSKILKPKREIERSIEKLNLINVFEV